MKNQAILTYKINDHLFDFFVNGIYLCSIHPSNLSEDIKNELGIKRKSQFRLQLDILSNPDLEIISRGEVDFYLDCENRGMSLYVHLNGKLIDAELRNLFLEEPQEKQFWYSEPIRDFQVNEMIGVYTRENGKLTFIKELKVI